MKSIKDLTEKAQSTVLKNFNSEARPLEFALKLSHITCVTLTKLHNYSVSASSNDEDLLHVDNGRIKLAVYVQKVWNRVWH